MVSQFEGGCTSKEPSSRLIFFAGCRRFLELTFLAFVARNLSYLSFDSDFLLHSLGGGD